MYLPALTLCKPGQCAGNLMCIYLKTGYTEDSSQKIKYGIVAIMTAHQRCWLKSNLKYNDAIIAKIKYAV